MLVILLFRGKRMDNSLIKEFNTSQIILIRKLDQLRHCQHLEWINLSYRQLHRFWAETYQFLKLKERLSYQQRNNKAGKINNLNKFKLSIHQPYSHPWYIKRVIAAR